MKINPAPLHLAQTVITGLVLALSIAILGTSAHTLDVFNKQQTSNPWWLPLWPQHFDVHGTKALIAASATTVVLSIVSLVCAFIPTFKQRHTLRALLSLATTLPTTLVTLVTVIYVHILNSDSPELDTIQTWSCKYKSAQPLQQDPSLKLPSNMGNGGFKAICTESKFALYGTLTVFLLLGLNMALAIVTWLADKWAARSQRKEVEMGGVPQS